MLGLRRKIGLALACAMVAAPISAQETAPGTRLLQQTGVIELDGPFFPGEAVDHRLNYARFDKTGNATEFLSVDPATAKQSVIATHIRQFSKLLFADARTTVIWEAPNVVVFDTATGKERFRFKPPHAADIGTIVGDELIMVGGAGSYPVKFTLDRYDLAKRAITFSRETSDYIADPVFWKDKLVVVWQMMIDIYDRNFNKIASLPAPDRQNGWCRIVTRKVYGNRLVFLNSCGRAVTVDLDKLAVQSDSGHYDPSVQMTFDVVNDTLFEVPIDEQTNGGIFDLATGRQLGVLPFRAGSVAVAGDNIAALHAESSNKLSILFFHFDRGALSDTAQGDALAAARTRARSVLARSGSVVDALDTLEKTPTSLLRAGDGLDGEQRATALDYGAWLAATLDRPDEGLALLDRLVAARPDDPVARRRLGAALLRNYLLTNAPESLARAKTLIDLPALAQADVPAARPAPIDFGAFDDHIVFWRDKIVVGRWKYAPGSACCTGASVALFDRKTLQLLSAPIQIHPDNDHADEVAAVTFGDENIFAWLSYDDEEPGHANLAVVDPQTRRVTLRVVPGGAVSHALSTPRGFVVCTDNNDCRLDDAQTLGQMNRDFYCGLMDLEGEDAADQEALATLIGADCSAPLKGIPVALSKDWLITKDGPWPGPYRVFYRRLAKDSSWQNTDYRIIGDYRRMLIAPGKDFAVGLNVVAGSARFARIDLTDGTYRTLLAVASPKDLPDLAWTVTDRLLLIGSGHDLIVYDLADDRLAGVLRDVTPPPVDKSADTARINRLLFDGSHVIVLAKDGRYSRVLDMPDVARFVAQSAKNFAAVDRLLQQ